MSEEVFGNLTLQLCILLVTAHVLGYLFTRIRQPRVIGEIFAGVLVGPSLLGHFAPSVATKVFSSLGSPQAGGAVLGFIYQLGLLLLMFVSGAEMRGLFHRDDRKPVLWLSIIGTVVPFVVALVLSSRLPLDSLLGPAQKHVSLVLVLGIAVAVTSIPVISRIFFDLGILKTRFARVVLGVAVLEDIALWAVLAIAMALAADSALPAMKIVSHVSLTLVYLLVGLFVAPPLLRRVASARWNIVSASSPEAFAMLVLLAYSALAGAMKVSLVFAAFLAGFALSADAVGSAAAMAHINKFSFAVFVPVYFAIVGYRLDLSRSFSLSMFLSVLIGACVLKLFSVMAGAKFAGFGWRSAVNLAIATNARGGPGIVLASVAYDAKIISVAFFTTLVLLAVFTSQAAGFWLEHVLSSKRPLLEEEEISAPPSTADEQQLVA